MMPFLSALLSRLLIDRRGGHRSQVLAAYRASLAFEAAPAEARQVARAGALADLLRHARKSVPHFRDLLPPAEGIQAEQAFAVLAGLPMLRRADIQQQPDRFICPGIAARDDATGGSTGTPLRFKVDAATQRAREASLMWADHLAGWRYGDRIGMLWGSDKDVKSATGALRSALRWWVDNRRWYNAFDLGEREMEAAHADLSRFRPHVLVAYANTAYSFARFLSARGLTPAYPLTAIISSAEVLAPEARAEMERVFRRPVFNRYGNREAGAIAAECVAHDGLHVNELDFVVEIDSADPFTQPGPVLITYLRNRAMPLIRYDTGDLACWMPAGPCPCGRTAARLARIVGRQSDIIRTRGGRWIHGEFFTHLFYGAREVREFQFIQDSLDDYRLLLVGDRALCAAREAEWRDRIRAEVGAGARVAFDYVDRIPTGASGKRKFTLSHLPPAPR